MTLLEMIDPIRLPKKSSEEASGRTQCISTRTDRLTTRDVLKPLFKDGEAKFAAEDVPRRPMPPWIRFTFVSVLLLIGFTFVLSGFTASRAYLYAPFADVHDWAADVFEAEHTQAWLAYLWKPHTEQRIATARMTELLDIEVFRGRVPVYLLMSAGLWLLGVGSGVALVLRSKLWPETRLYVALACGLIVSDVAMAEDLALPVFSVYLFVAGPVLALASTFALSAEKNLRLPMLIASIGLAGLASLGNAAGLAVWPALAGAALLQGRSRSQVLVVVAAGALSIALIEAGLGVPSASLGASGDGASHLIKIATYFMMFAGLPWERALHPDLLACGLGLIVWLAAARSLYVSWRRPDVTRSLLSEAATVLILFGFLTASMATIGRVDELPAAVVPTRYTPFAALLQVGVVLGFVEGVDRGLRQRRGAAFLITGLAVAASLIMAADWHASRSLPRLAAKIRAAGEMLDRGVVSKDVIIYPRPAFAAAVRARLRARGLPS